MSSKAFAMAALAAPCAAFVPQAGLRGATPAQAQAQAQGHPEAPGAAAGPIGQAAAAGAIGASAMCLAAAGAAAAASAPRRGARVGRRVAGICLPLTEKFDPLNLGNTDAKMERYTAVEIKHGRISMIAVVGYVVPEIFRFPGCENFESGLGALSSIPLEGWIQLAAFIGAHEVLVKPREGGMGAYDLGFGTELLEGIRDEELERRQTVERNNGRLAMVAILGLMWQDGTFGKSPIAFLSSDGWFGPNLDFLIKDITICQVGETLRCATKERASGVRRMAVADDAALPDMTKPGWSAKMPKGGWNAIGARADSAVSMRKAERLMNEPMSPAVPFLRYPAQLKGWVGGEKGFDPMAITELIPVYWCREAELKHGRVAMLATVGWIATDLGLRFPAEKFQGLSNIQAHDVMVENGTFRVALALIGVIELYGAFLINEGFLENNPARDAGDFFIGKNFLPKDEQKADEMRLKELENGRLAMIAFGGIVTQAQVFGTTWPFF